MEQKPIHPDFCSHSLAQYIGSTETSDLYLVQSYLNDCPEICRRYGPNPEDYETISLKYQAEEFWDYMKFAADKATGERPPKPSPTP